MWFTPFRRGLLVFALFFGFFAIAINSGSNNWLNLYQLTKSSTSTQATVTAIYPENHNGCTFAHTVNGRAYSHLESCHLIVGSETSLIYLPVEPSVAIVRSASDELKAAIEVPLGMSIIAGILAALGQRLIVQRRIEKRN